MTASETQLLLQLTKDIYAASFTPTGHTWNDNEARFNAGIKTSLINIFDTLVELREKASKS